MLRFFDSTGLGTALVREEKGHPQAASLLEEHAGRNLSVYRKGTQHVESISILVEQRC